MSRARSGLKLVLFMLVVLLVPAAACTPQGEKSAAPKASAGPTAGAEVPERVKIAAQIARAIQADPGSMNRILEGKGMTRENFEDLLYEIAADPVLCEAYIQELGS